MTKKIQLDLEIGTTGEGNIELVASELRDLGKTSEEAQEAVVPLQKELESLQKKASAQAGFLSLKEAIEKIDNASDAAWSKLAKLSDKISESAAPSLRLTAQYKDQIDKVNALGLKKQELNSRLGAMRNKLRAAGLETENLTKNQVRLNASFADVKSKADTLQREYIESANAAKELGRQTKEAGNAANKSATAYTDLGAALKIAALAAAAKQLYDAATSSETLSRGLTAATGSAEAGAEAMRFVQSTAQQLGIGINEAGNAYVGLAAAARSAGLDTADTQGIFASVAGAMSALGRSTADTEGALLAVGQMLSKGTVSAEELRGQLGERLPGAMAVAAASVGKTEQEFGKLLESGQIIAKDFLPKFAAELRKTAGSDKPVQSLSASFARLQNSVTVAMAAFSDSGPAEGAAELFDKIGGLVEHLGVGLSTLAVRFRQAGEEFGTQAAAIANWDFSNLDDALRQIGERADDDIRAAADRVYGLGDAIDSTGAQTGKAVTAAQLLAEQERDLAVEFGGAAEAAKKRADATKESAAADIAAAELAQRRAQITATEIDDLRTLADLNRAKAQSAAELLATEQQQLAASESALAAKRAEIEASGHQTVKHSEEISALQLEIEAKRGAVAMARQAKDAADFEASGIAQLAAIRRAANDSALRDATSLREIRRRDMSDRDLQYDLEKEVAEEIRKSAQLAKEGAFTESKAALDRARAAATRIKDSGDAEAAYKKVVAAAQQAAREEEAATKAAIAGEAEKQAAIQQTAESTKTAAEKSGAKPGQPQQIKVDTTEAQQAVKKLQDMIESLPDVKIVRVKVVREGAAIDDLIDDLSRDSRS